ncbi:lipoprotein intramolecular transacylase Lit [Zhihengliuella salsuginis]|uniref:Integral membrane protein TIGR01906 n=1 Tax=Zhihengliuella salsuginis TaxID=578222 RepID=A0ABQ3GIX9_9MICC|nr:DUF1461 domain-containing protein [Zhihengliuella salsuginis]GHD09707.1 hypothetical protein GCM10008096_22640 [Zhihengliuella salsuginis]
MSEKANSASASESATEPIERPSGLRSDAAPDAQKASGPGTAQPAADPAPEEKTETAALPTSEPRRGRRSAESAGEASGGGTAADDPVAGAAAEREKSPASATKVLRSAEAAAARATPEPVAAPVADPADSKRRGDAREAALRAKPLGPRIVQTLLAVVYPFLLVIGALKAVASPWFLWLEYHRPGFPADEFGWDTAQRLTYGSYGVDYLNNAAGAGFLGGLVGADGAPLMTDSEVSHMADVKAVIATSFAAGFVLLVLAALMVWFLARRYPGGVRRGLFAGAVATLVAAVALAALAILNWGAFFTGVHGLFFADGTWTFQYSDTLLRLYPEQFWVDAGIGVGVLVLLAVVATLIATWPTRSRRDRSRIRVNGRRSA